MQAAAVLSSELKGSRRAGSLLEMQPALDAHLRVAVMTRELADGEYRAAMEHRGELMEALLAEMAGVAERESVGEILAALPGFDEQLGPTGEAAAERERLRRQAKGLVDLMMVQLGDAKQAADPEQIMAALVAAADYPEVPRRPSVRGLHLFSLSLLAVTLPHPQVTNPCSKYRLSSSMMALITSFPLLRHIATPLYISSGGLGGAGGGGAALRGSADGGAGRVGGGGQDGWRGGGWGATGGPGGLGGRGG